MDLVLYQSDYFKRNPGIEDFLDGLRSRRLTYLASSFLEKGLEPGDIVEAVKRAITVCQTAEIPVEEHFKPVYSSYRGSLVRDCKLSRFGFLLTAINARPDCELTATWQSRLLDQLI